MSPYYNKEKHDIGILRSDGTTEVGLLLDRYIDKVTRKEIPRYGIVYDNYLVNQYTTAPDFGSTNPIQELPVVGDDWRAGFGQEVYDSANPLSYYESFGMDLRHKNQAIAGWTSTGIALPAITSAGSISNADMETDASGWTGGLREGTHYLSGSYGWRLDNATAYQDLTWNANHVGHTYRFRCWAWASVASTCRISIDDGITVTYSDYHTGGSAFEQLTVSATIGSTATRLRIQITSGAASAVCWFDDAELVQPVAGTIKSMMEFGTKLYFGIGNELYKLNATGDGFTSVGIFPTAIIKLEKFSGNLYIVLDHGIVIEDCEDAWTGNANVTCTADTGDYKVGAASAKEVIAAGLAVNSLIAYEDFSALNISSADGLDFWFKTSKTITAGQLKIQLDNTSGCVSPTESIDLPAVTAGQWTTVHVDLAAKSTDTAIISVALYQVADIGACTIHIDNVKLAYKYWIMNIGEVFTRSTLTNAYFDFMCNVDKATPTLYGGHTPNVLRASTDPTNSGSWGTPTLIGSYVHNITGMVEWNGTVYIMKETKPFYIDSNGAAVGGLAPELITEKATTSGKNAFVWHNKIYIPAGSQVLLESDGTTNTFRSPAGYITNSSSFTGIVQALAGDAFYLYAITDNSTKVEVNAGRLEDIDGTISWVWHPIHELTLTGAETAYVATIFQKSLWISSTSSNDSLYRLPLPSSYGNITSDANRSFKTDTYFITPWYHGKFKGSVKTFPSITASMGHTYDANIYFECWYQALGGSWVDMGDFKGSATSMTQTLFNTTPPSSAMFRFKFVAKTNDTTKTPILNNFEAKFILRPTTRIIHEYFVQCKDYMEDKKGDPLQGENAAYIRATLVEARDTTGVITFYDTQGATKYGILLPVELFAEPVASQSSENIEEVYHLRIQEVNLS